MALIPRGTATLRSGMDSSLVNSRLNMIFKNSLYRVILA